MATGCYTFPFPSFPLPPTLNRAVCSENLLLSTPASPPPLPSDGNRLLLHFTHSFPSFPVASHTKSGGVTDCYAPPRSIVNYEVTPITSGFVRSEGGPKAVWWEGHALVLMAMLDGPWQPGEPLEAAFVSTLQVPIAGAMAAARSVALIGATVYDIMGAS